MSSKGTDTGDRVVGGGKYMREIMTIDTQGNITMQTHVLTHVSLAGYHGGVIVTLCDKDKNILWASPLCVYGVDGESWLVPGVSDRWATETFKVDPVVYASTDRIDVWMGITPRNTFIPWLEKWGEKLLDVILWIASAFGDGASSSDTDGSTESAGLYHNVTQGLVQEATITPLSIPVLLSPSDGAHFTNYPRTTQLQWQPVDGANQYRVNVEFRNGGREEDNPWSNLFTKLVNSTSLSFDFVGDQPGRWRVTALNRALTASSPVSNWRTFDYLTAPKQLATPVPASPLNGSILTNFPRTTKLKWETVANANSYMVEIDYRMPGPEVNNPWATLTTFNTSNLEVSFNFPGDQPGRWRVIAIDRNGVNRQSQPSAWQSFEYKTGPQQLDTPTLLSPVDKAIVVTRARIGTEAPSSGSVKLEWQEVNAATSYKIDVNKKKDDLWQPIISKSLTSTSMDMLLNEPSMYQWRVTALDQIGVNNKSQPSAWRTFSYAGKLLTGPTIPPIIPKRPVILPYPHP
jgi:hypothetical protein